jgi:hypothetical protein
MCGLRRREGSIYLTRSISEKEERSMIICALMRRVRREELIR